MENKNELKVNVATGEVMTATPPEVLSDEQIAALVAGSMNGEMTLFQSSGIEDGTADTPLKALKKLDTPDVVCRDLHINIIHISRATATEGEIVDKSDYPVVCFDEFPGCRYSGGKRLMQLVTTWAKACGDEINVEDKGERKGYVFNGNRLLPKLNDYIAKGNRPRVILKKKDGANYTDVFVLGI